MIRVKRVVTRAIVLLLVVLLFASTHTDAVAGQPVFVQSDYYPMTYVGPGGNTIIEISKERFFKSDCFVARIVTDNPHLIRACFAQDDFKKVGPMSVVAEEHEAVFMVNADWCTIDFCDNFVIRNGEICRDGQPERAICSYLCIMNSGHLEFVGLRTSAKNALDIGVFHSFSFWGDNLFNNGKPSGNENGVAPRTFIGEVPRNDGFLEYIIVVADGRSIRSRGLTNYEESIILFVYGCDIGYNLDGGGSSEMVFDGKILNVPSDGCERYDHDFIYVKYGD